MISFSCSIMWARGDTIRCVAGGLGRQMVLSAQFSCFPALKKKPATVKLEKGPEDDFAAYNDDTQGQDEYDFM